MVRELTTLIYHIHDDSWGVSNSPGLNHAQAAAPGAHGFGGARFDLGAADWNLAVHRLSNQDGEEWLVEPMVEPWLSNG